MGDPHSSADAEYSDGRYRLRCTCGWTSTWHADAASDRPPNYVEIILANMGRPRVGYEELRRLELGPNRCSVAAGGPAA